MHKPACRTNGAPPWGQPQFLGSWCVPQNFLFPQRDQPLLLPAVMREWLPEDDLVFVVLDAVATLDLGEFRRRYRADGHGRAAFDPEMMVALLLSGYCQGERSSRVIEKRCVRDVAYRVIAGGLHPDHATIARFRARHEKALGGLSVQVLRLLAAGGMVSLGTISLDGTKLAGNAAQQAYKTLPQIDKVLAEAAAADDSEDAQLGGKPGEPAPRALARRAGRRERLAAARDRLAAEDKARRDTQRAKQVAWDAAAADRRQRAARRPADQPLPTATTPGGPAYWPSALTQMCTRRLTGTTSPSSTCTPWSKSACATTPESAACSVLRWLVPSRVTEACGTCGGEARTC
jgi:transposase